MGVLPRVLALGLAFSAVTATVASARAWWAVLPLLVSGRVVEGRVVLGDAACELGGARCVEFLYPEEGGGMAVGTSRYPLPGGGWSGGEDVGVVVPRGEGGEPMLRAQLWWWGWGGGVGLGVLAWRLWRAARTEWRRGMSTGNKPGAGGVQG